MQNKDTLGSIFSELHSFDSFLLILHKHEGTVGILDFGLDIVYHPLFIVIHEDDERLVNVQPTNLFKELEESVILVGKAFTSVLTNFLDILDNGSHCWHFVNLNIFDALP